ncbi:MAG TPA: helix-turn-helix domain-containing protein [Candidatus Limnocylindria bacterium]|nr:helix-turn-helix domain-containing protein [Candidatus Limnocylindria bacterium]
MSGSLVGLPATPRQPDRSGGATVRAMEPTTGAPASSKRSSATGRPQTSLDAGVGSASASSLRRAILMHLRQAGPSSPDSLASALHASRTGVLQQLHALEDAGLVTHSAEKHGVGRPRHLYDVTAEAQGLFPTDYGGFASGLVKAIEAVGGDDLVEQVFAARRRQIGDRVRRRMSQELSDDAPLVDRVRVLAVLQNEAGYLAEAVNGTDGELRLREHNCAIDKIARRTSAPCDAELALFRELLGPGVERESHIASGDRCCSYVVSDAVIPGERAD